MNCPQLESSLERLFTTVSQPIPEILGHALSGHDITVAAAAPAAVTPAELQGALIGALKSGAKRA